MTSEDPPVGSWNGEQVNITPRWWPIDANFAKAIEAQGLAPLRDALGQVEGIDFAIEDTGGMTLVGFVRLPSGRRFGITRSDECADYSSPDGWMVCYYRSEDSEGELMHSDATMKAVMAFIWAAHRP